MIDAGYEHSFFQSFDFNATQWDTFGLPWVGQSGLFLNMTRAFIYLGYDINFPEQELTGFFHHVIEPYSIASLPLPVSAGGQLPTQVSYYAAYPPLAPSLAPASVPQEQLIMFFFDFDRDTFTQTFRGSAGDFSAYPGAIVYYDSITVPTGHAAGVPIAAAKSPFAPTWNKDDTRFLMVAVSDGNADACTVKIGNMLTPHTPPGATRSVLGSVNTQPTGVFPVPDPVAVEIDGLGVTGESCFCEAVPLNTTVDSGVIYVEVIKI